MKEVVKETYEDVINHAIQEKNLKIEEREDKKNDKELQKVRGCHKLLDP